MQQGILAVRSKLDLVREAYRQLVVGHGHDPVIRAVDDGNRHAPVALARDQPVPQAEGDGPPADPHALGLGTDPLDPLLDAEPAEGSGVDQHPVIGFKRLVERLAGRLAIDTDDAPDR